MKPFWIYMLRLSNGSLYTGYARDLERRFEAHRRGRGSRITRSFKPLEIVACWKVHSGRAQAMAVEAWIKGLSRPQKQELIDHPEALAVHLKRRGRGERVEPTDPPR